jgi:TPP-dependent pyruvate/acetoin dehydrogenase alpha subunit
MYRTMKKIRYFEEKIYDLYQRNIVRGAAHLSVGQEAIAAGVCEVLSPEDHVLSTHRGHGHCLAKGADPTRMFAELLGKADGYCKGKGGSMHISDFASGILCANGIVGGGLPIAVGAGLAKSLKRTPSIIVCFFGDGAVGQGVFHESLNLAQVWQLPILYVCENNGFAISTPAKRTIATQNISELAAAYGMPAVTIDGNDMIEVYQTARTSKEHILEHGGPAFIEGHTYRLSGHYIGDDERYRDREETKQQWASEPIAVFENWAQTNRPELIDVLEEIDQQVKEEISTAAETAVQGDEPPLEVALQDVFNKTGPAWDRRTIRESDFGTTSS